MVSNNSLVPFVVLSSNRVHGIEHCDGRVCRIPCRHCGSLLRCTDGLHPTTPSTMAGSASQVLAFIVSGIYLGRLLGRVLMLDVVV